MQKISGFGMKDCLLLPRLRWKYFSSSGEENDEPIYTYKDKNMRWFVRQKIKRGRISAYNQYYFSNICDEISE